MSSLASALEAFFTSWLLNQRRASPHTIAAYRDTFRLLLGFAQAQLGKPPAQLDLADLDAALIGAFLDHLERQRGNSIRSRNARLAAVRSFFRFAALREPGHAALIQRVLAIPPKRCERALITFLTRPRDRRAAGRTRPLRLDRPPRPRPAAHRDPDRAARVRTDPIALPGRRTRHRRPPALPRQGPQRPDHPADHANRRRAPHLATRARRHPRRPAVPHPPRRTTQPGRSRVPAHQARRHGSTALPVATRQETIASRATPHHRHATTQAGIDISVIALRLGHESIETTQVYLHADLALKEQALARTTVARR